MKILAFEVIARQLGFEYDAIRFSELHPSL